MIQGLQSSRSKGHGREAGRRQPGGEEEVALPTGMSIRGADLTRWWGAEGCLAVWVF